MIITTDPRARKPHTCQTCQRTIQPGETYTREDELNHGVYSRIDCTQCDSCWTRYSVEEDLREGDAPEGSWLIEWLDEAYPTTAARLRTQWHDTAGTMTWPEWQDGVA